MEAVMLKSIIRNLNYSFMEKQKYEKGIVGN